MEVPSIEKLELILATRPVTCVYFYKPTCHSCIQLNQILLTQMKSIPSNHPVIKVNVSSSAFEVLPDHFPVIHHVPCVMVFTQRGYRWININEPLKNMFPVAVEVMNLELEVEFMPPPHSVLLLTPEEESDDDYVKGFYKASQIIKQRKQVPVNRVVEPKSKLMKIFVLKNGVMSEFKPSDLPHVQSILDNL